MPLLNLTNPSSPPLLSRDYHQPSLSRFVPTLLLRVVSPFFSSPFCFLPLDNLSPPPTLPLPHPTLLSFSLPFPILSRTCHPSSPPSRSPTLPRSVTLAFFAFHSVLICSLFALLLLLPRLLRKLPLALSLPSTRTRSLSVGSCQLGLSPSLSDYLFVTPSHFFQHLLLPPWLARALTANSRALSRARSAATASTSFSLSPQLPAAVPILSLSLSPFLPVPLSVRRRMSPAFESIGRSLVRAGGHPPRRHPWLVHPPHPLRQGGGEEASPPTPLAAAFFFAVPSDLLYHIRHQHYTSARLFLL